MPIESVGNHQGRRHNFKVGGGGFVTTAREVWEMFSTFKIQQYPGCQYKAQLTVSVNMMSVSKALYSVY